MHLTPREIDKLMIATAAELARKRRARRIRLNNPETMTLITEEILKHDDVMEGVPEMIEEVQVESTFPDGTKLVTVHHPIR